MCCCEVGDCCMVPEGVIGKLTSFSLLFLIFSLLCFGPKSFSSPTRFTSRLSVFISCWAPFIFSRPTPCLALATLLANQR